MQLKLFFQERDSKIINKLKILHDVSALEISKHMYFFKIVVY